MVTERSKVAILGFGEEGKAVLKFLLKDKTYKNSEITICDKNEKIRSLPRRKNVGFQLGGNYLKNLQEFDVVFRSPGVPFNLPEIQKAVKAGVKFSSATGIFFEETEKIGCKVIGITGTKGKGTVATLLYKIIKASGFEVYLAGNIGKPATEILPKISGKSLVILELSSFQLQDLKFSPDVAVVLEIFPDHLDAHKSFKEYVDAKANIAKWQKKSGKIFYFADDKYSHQLVSKSPAKKIPVKINAGVLSEKDLKIPGAHNFKNALMAYNVALSFGCPKDKVLNVIRHFKGNEHRLEFVRKANKIVFYNDSASTNPQTAAAAVKSFTGQKILIAGGKDKNLDYAPLVRALKDSNTELVVLFGENKNKIRRELRILKNELRIQTAKDLNDAVKIAYSRAKKIRIPDSSFVILFSPAAASFDMFKDYKERGRKFKDILRNLKSKKTD